VKNTEILSVSRI